MCTQLLNLRHQHDRDRNLHGAPFWRIALAVATASLSTQAF